MFKRCISLPCIQDLTEFDFSSVESKNDIFNDCFSSINLFDMSLINSNKMKKPNIKESKANSEYEQRITDDFLRKMYRSYLKNKLNKK